ncbi:gamma-glutamyl-gamma-aminobutyrate hydrolase family protein [Leucobacter denitrificans]|uniref:Gamma-glutamyl-gamma-aminobutyrate hydrolase family protein n=1 Tax=Leucobacter denitrificans TaxID=683042 RepID=A0A7G9S5B0_9MICO|nr:gamma-glutamyl-gamma-aminobutyrate hydrolase family protein [Leucobacter denitrificans]QNN63035.1 gamma-glutamyl-gamma-aminobutyrate hydrolase family protein [Leucobacter denitrificans]
MTTAPNNFSVAVTYVDSDNMPVDYRSEIIALRDVVVSKLGALGINVVTINAASPVESSSSALETADGVVVMGGVDIDPALYGQSVESDTVKHLHPEADEYEIEMIRGAYGADTPVFGICRGSQLINVAFGGTLIQDLGPGIHVTAVSENEPTEDGDWNNHDIVISEGTALAEILGESRIDARVSHHQAVDALGEGLRVSAHADDGVIEGIEATGGWVVGVQWHPEEKNSDPAQLNRLLEGFVLAIEERTRQRAA